ncbi:helicase-exonuclease AddAB subunit AddB [Alteribacillus sp. HJP-4]|uniref:helicase-exonuclease AddAB subunit AddB n=1 Tax=Alteribacillus sp. HJP-4 TaxID=2775394 RepID=UPI0035CD0CE4
MGLTFYIGRSGTGKTSAMISEMAELINRSPAGTPSIIYLVPDQMSFQSEQKLIKQTNAGMTRAHVLSFSRLAWRVLQETGGITKTVIQQNGMHMLIRKVIEEEKQSFHLYNKAAGREGFILQMERLFTEFKRHLVTLDSLEEEWKQLQQKEKLSAREKALKDKLHDILLLWRKIDQFLQGSYVGTEDSLALLADSIPDSTLLESCYVYIDGFHSFTPQELNVIKALLSKADQVTAALTLDKPYDDEPPHFLNLFHQTAMTYRKLKALSKETSTIHKDTKQFFRSAHSKEGDLLHLEKYFEKNPPVQEKRNEHISINSAVNRRAETEAAARNIRKLVREHGYRFKDIAVMIRKSEAYAELIETTFTDYGLPLFIDEKRPMLNHPVIELLRSSLEIIVERWRYEPVFRAIKTDLLFDLEESIEDARREADLLENYVLAYGIKEKHWKLNRPWAYRKSRNAIEEKGNLSPEEEELEKIINKRRSQLAKPLLRLEKKLKRSTTFIEYGQSVFEFLEDLKIPQKIEMLRDHAAARNELTRAGEHEQVWGAIVELLDQMVEIAEDDKVSTVRFHKIMEAGLESMKFSLVPPAIDQITVADMERSRLSDIKAVFILGVNEGLIPAVPEEDGILHDEEREWFNERGVELADDSARMLLDERFLMYRALSIASERLSLSYALADEEGKSLQPSTLIQQIKEMFPHLKEKQVFQHPDEYKSTQQLDFIGSDRKTLSYVTYQLQRWKRGYPISNIWWDVYNWAILKDDGFYAAPTLQSLFYTNRPQSLSEPVSLKIYGEKLKASVSRVERFESCAFSHFVSYGLRLKERDIFRLEAPDIGQLFHSALQQMTEAFQKEGKDWKDISKEDAVRTAKATVQKLAPAIQREILLSSDRYKYLLRKLEDTIIRASDILNRQAKASGYSPYGMEVGFGENEQLPPLRFTLPNGVEMEVAGRIDRVDKASGEGGLYVRIIDYKSSQKDLQIPEIYYGLALQMLVYMDVVLSFSEDWFGREALPGGVLYFHVHNPFIQAAQHLSEEEIEEEFFKKYKMKGLLLAQEEAVRLMDLPLESGRSEIVPAAFKKDGSFYANSSVLSKENFADLRQFIRSKLEEVGSSIIEGDTQINPYKVKQLTACSYCPFKAVCQFDTSFEGNGYKTLSTDKKQIMKSLFKEGDGTIDSN